MFPPNEQFNFPPADPYRTIKVPNFSPTYQSDAPAHLLARQMEEDDNDVDPHAVTYHSTPTGTKFHLDHESRVKAVMSAYGGGKTVMVLFEMLFKMQQQAPDRLKRRRSRWVVVRATYSQLKTTVLESWQDWMPPNICRIKSAPPMEALINMDLGDGTRVEAQVYFLALDRPDQMRILQGLELTGGWINEAVEIADENVLKNVLGRCGRFPKKVDAPITWSGVLLDYNPPVRGTWLWKLFERQKPAGYTLYKMPPPIFAVPDPEFPNDVDKITFHPNPAAENIENLDEGYDYYLNQAEDLRYDWPLLTRRVLGDYPVSQGGNPVFPLFNPTRHVRSVVDPNPGSLLVIGMDFGLYGAGVFTQYVDGEVRVLDSYEEPESSLFDIIDNIIRPKIRSRFTNYQVVVTGDPAGSQRSSLTPEKLSSIKLLRQAGFKFIDCKSNAFSMRRDAVNWMLRRHDGFVIDERNERLVQALAGEYAWRKNINGQRAEEPDKTKGFDHICFAAGTLIDTPSGPTSIDSLRQGDVITTPHGPQAVACAHSHDAECIEFDGLIGTPEHPVWTKYGFIPWSDALQYGVPIRGRSVVWRIQYVLSRFVLPRSSQYTNLEAGVTTGGSPATTTVGSRMMTSIFTELCGGQTTDPYQLASKCIIKILTGLTTPSRTWNSWMGQTMHGYTSACEPIWTEKPISDQPKMPPRVSAERTPGGQVNLRKRLTRKLARLSNSIGIAPARWSDDALVVENLRRSVKLATQGPDLIAGSVLAKQNRIDVQDGCVGSRSVRCTGLFATIVAALTKPLRSRTTLSQLEARPVGVRTVHSLSVPSGAYYANGLLVSNCDALQYAAMYFRHGGATFVEGVQPPYGQFTDPADWLSGPVDHNGNRYTPGHFPQSTPLMSVGRNHRFL